MKIIGRQKEKWAKTIQEKRLTITTVQAIQDCSRTYPQRTNDNRQITKILDQEKYQYYTYQLLSKNKLLYIVIKGDPEPTPVEQIYEDLVSKGFDPDKVKKMYSRKDKTTLPRVLVTLPTGEKNIYQIIYVINKFKNRGRITKTQNSEVSQFH